MDKSKNFPYREPNESPLVKTLSDSVGARSKLCATIALLFMVVLQVGCSKNNFEVDSSSDFSSTATPLAGANHSMQARTVNFPFYIQSLNIPMQLEQTELFITPQADLRTCQVQSFNKPIGNSHLCLDAPDLCWSSVVTTLDRDKDFTCAQAFQAQAIASTKANNSCVPKIDFLSAEELQQIKDPQIYSITSGLNWLDLGSHLSTASNIQSFFENQQAQAIPLLQGIILDASCRCSYSSDAGQTDDQFPSDSNLASSQHSFLRFQYPALPEHCHAHFSDSY